MKNLLSLIAIIGLISFSSCKKKNVAPTPTDEVLCTLKRTSTTPDGVKGSGTLTITANPTVKGTLVIHYEMTTYETYGWPNPDPRTTGTEVFDFNKKDVGAEKTIITFNYEGDAEDYVIKEYNYTSK